MIDKGWLWLKSAKGTTENQFFLSKFVYCLTLNYIKAGNKLVRKMVINKSYFTVG